MEKEFIPYTEALALKELGFDEKCFGAYDKKCKLAIATSDYWNIQSLYSLNGYFGKNTYRCLAPLYQQAFRWFRENYKMCHWVYQSNDESYFYSILKQGRYLVTNSSEYKTYEEAELECLKKLIEIAKK